MGMAVTVGLGAIPVVRRVFANKFLNFTVHKGGTLTGFTSKVGAKIAQYGESNFNRMAEGFVGWDSSYQMGEDVLRQAQGLEAKNNYNMYDAMTSYGLGLGLNMAGIPLKAIYGGMKKVNKAFDNKIIKNVKKSYVASKDAKMYSRKFEINPTASVDLDIFEMRKIAKETLEKIKTGDVSQADAAVEVFNKLDEGYKSGKNMERLQKFFSSGE